MLLSACDTAKEGISGDQASSPASKPASSVVQTVEPSVPEGLKVVEGQTVISKKGLKINTVKPTEGAAKVAWDFFRLRGEQKYDEAVKVLYGSRDKDNLKIYGQWASKPDDPYLIEVIGADFVRWADITSFAPKEGEDEGTAHYKVIYIEVNLKVRGKLTENETDMRNGLNRYAIHVVQEKEGDPWEISLVGGAPWMEK